MMKTTPMQLWSGTVRPEWTDYNGHMTEFRYLQVFSDNLDLFYEELGINMKDIRIGSYFTVETHIRHLAECNEGQSLHATIQVLGLREKKLLVYQQIIKEDGTIVATAEQLAIYVVSSRSAPAPWKVRTQIEKLMQNCAAFKTHKKLFCSID